MRERADRTPTCWRTATKTNRRPRCRVTRTTRTPCRWLHPLAGFVTERWSSCRGLEESPASARPSSSRIAGRSNQAAAGRRRRPGKGLPAPLGGGQPSSEAAVPRALRLESPGRFANRRSAIPDTRAAAREVSRPSCVLVVARGMRRLLRSSCQGKSRAPTWPKNGLGCEFAFISPTRPLFRSAGLTDTTVVVR